MKKVIIILILGFGLFFSLVLPLSGQNIPQDLQLVVDLAELEREIDNNLASADLAKVKEYLRKLDSFMASGLDQSFLTGIPSLKIRVVKVEKVLQMKADLLKLKNKGFILVEGGTFYMGGIGNGDYALLQAHNVTLSSFYISKYEVTQKEYKALIGTNPSHPEKGIGDNYPVNKVSWYDAVEYCNALSRKEGLTPVYTGSGENIKMNINANGYRLPTEAEWEFAAKGGNSSRGYLYAGSNSKDSVAWHWNNSGRKVHPVGGKKANELGLYDMTGNVAEWCWDWDGYYDTNHQTNPTAYTTGTEKVNRGGSLRSSRDINCETSTRSHSSPSSTYESTGFRLVRRP
jgi:formylglycine-generating enzyme required for sulfatase activity